MKKINTEDLKRIQLGILDSVVEFCNKNGISYYLAYGTLIGAVRHHGYIPWDDDIDICMKRDDYNRFFATFNTERKDNYRAVSILNVDDYYLTSGKVIDTSTTLLEQNRNACNIGAYIDVFALDYLPNEKIVKSTIKKMNILQKVLIFKSVPISRERKFIKNLVLSIGFALLKPFSLESILSKMIEIATKYSDTDKAEYIGNVSAYVYGEKEIVPKWYYDETIELLFEGRSLSVPKEYDNILKKIYGDYMRLPPVEKRVTHHKFEVYYN